MKIAIVGGGISGLSAYLNLQKHAFEQPWFGEDARVVIYEPHDFQTNGGNREPGIPASGGGYGLAPNGMASIRRLDPSIHDRILRNGFPSPRTLIRAARGWELGVMPFLDTKGKEPECTVMCLRQVVIDALYERIPASVVDQRKVVSVEDGVHEAIVELQDGEKVVFDLVLGCDGVWSKARHAILGDKHGPEYKGLFSVGGFVSTDHLSQPPGKIQTVMTMGRNGFFGYSPYTTGSTVAGPAHIRGDATLPPGKWAFWWSRSAQEDPYENPDEAVLKRELLERHKEWKDPVIQRILANSEVVLRNATWVMPKLPKWSGKRVVLLGDAAHALPSSSGQGVSQSLEDAEAFALLLSHTLHLANGQVLSAEVLSTTSRQYTAIRKRHVEQVADIGNRTGDASRDMNVVMEMFMYAMFWVVLNVTGAFFLKPIANYDLRKEVEKFKTQA